MIRLLQDLLRRRDEAGYTELIWILAVVAIVLIILLILHVI